MSFWKWSSCVDCGSAFPVTRTQMERCDGCAGFPIGARSADAGSAKEIAALRLRAERAEAEVRAMAGDRAALVPFAPPGWCLTGGEWVRLVDRSIVGGAYSVRWWHKVEDGDTRGGGCAGYLDGMAQVEAALAAARCGGCCPDAC